MKVRNWGPRKFSGRGPFKELGMVLRLRTFPLGSAASRVTSTKNPERNISIWHLPIRSFAGSRLEKEHAARGQAIANSKEELESLKAQAGRSLEASNPSLAAASSAPGVSAELRSDGFVSCRGVRGKPCESLAQNLALKWNFWLGLPLPNLHLPGF